jgi:uncharacterized protein (TIRG00374 family)
VALAAVGVAAWVISGKADELSGISRYLDHLRWWWLVVAALAEIGSYAALSSLQRRLLRAGRVGVPATDMFGITLAAAAIQNSFPGGGVIYLAYLFRQFRRWGADDLLSGWVIVAFNLVTFGSLALLSAIGLGMALGANSYNLASFILAIVAFALILSVLVTERRRLLPHLVRALRLSQRLVRRPRPGTDTSAVVARWAEELAAVSPSRRTWLRAFVMGLCNWTADLACLVLSFMAVGVGVPWRGVILAYTAGQLATALPITPGGLGAVEGSLTVALVYFGGGTDSAVAAVLLYRMISFWMMLPLGWGSWGALALAGRRGRYRRVGTVGAGQPSDELSGGLAVDSPPGGGRS